MTRGRAALGSLVALATSCSLFTSLDGLSDGATEKNGGDGGDGGNVMTVDAVSDTSVGVDSEASTSTKPRAWRQIMVAGPPAVHSARMAYDDTRKKVVLYGGRGDATASDTWEWDGAAWTKSTTVTNPGPRSSPGLAYDSARGVTMLYAGSDGTPDPWEFDGTAWKSSGTSATSPDVRYSSAMTYDRARKVLVVFGGLHVGTPSVPNGETWEWSTTTGFMNRTPTMSPPARRANVLVYDSARSRVVTFGGYTGSGGDSLGDTWEWDGAAWTQRTPPTSPPARRGACGAFDAGRNVTVVFGGRDPQTNAKSLDDTWHWDGSSWSSGPHGPPARSSCAMAYDGARDQIVLFGGSPAHVGAAPPTSVNDTWVYE